MWPKFGNFSISMREVNITSILQWFDQENHIFWGVVLVKVRKFLELISTFVEVTGEKLVEGASHPDYN